MNKCPNCKADAAAKTVGGVEYIECKTCGWFITQADGSCEPCEAPQDTAAVGGEPTAPPARVKGGAVAVDAAPPGLIQAAPSSARRTGDGSPPSPAPSSDEGEIEITLTDEIDY